MEIMKDIIKPKKLKPGARIGVMSPSGYMLPERIERGVANLEARGYQVYVHPQAHARYHGSAGTTTEKIQALHDLFSDPEIDMVLTSRGGARAIHMLDGINYDLIRANPKLFIGYSDITVLLSAFYTHAGLSSVHGVQLAGFDPMKTRISAELTLPYLHGNWQQLGWPSDYATDIIQSGEVEGVLYGGNLHLLFALAAAGGDFFPDLTGKILIIEDIGEEMRSIDRMLGALRLRGVFRQIAGFVVGQMTDMVDTDHVPFERDVRSVVLEHTAGMKGPIVFRAPIGHEHPNVPFPVGIRARLTAMPGQAPQLQLLESPFSD